MTISIESFGQWVRQRRKQRGLTQKELGRLIGYAEITVRQIESDNYTLTRFVMERFVNCLAADSAEQDRITRFAHKQLPVSAGTLQYGASYRSGTPFIGRERELAHIADLLRNPDCRCISIVGIGGVGKTRLASRAFAAYTGEADHVAWFVTLTEINSAELMARTIADGMGVSLNPFAPPSEQLLLTLQSRQGLLVLDNFEQLIPEGIPVLTAVLERASGIKVIVTSRERLLITGEWMLRLQGLDITDHTFQSAAIDLFIRTAQRMNNQFISADLNPIREICRLVEGIPLAIEMAASWTELSSYTEILSSVSKKALDLTSRHRDLDERHRSLQAVFETTWERLTPREQEALKRMAIFRGGFTVAAAQEVAGADMGLLAYLQDKMLIQPQSEGRLVLHEMIRQLALQKLTLKEPELLAARLQHGEYYIKRLTHSAQRIKYIHTADEIGQINSEIENVRAAWETMLRQHRTDWFYSCWESLWLFFNVTSRFHEGEMLFHSAMTAFTIPDATEVESHVRDFSQIFLALFLFRQGRIPESVNLLFTPEMERIRASSIPLDQYWVHLGDSFVFHAVGNAAAALRSIESAQQFVTSMGNDVYAVAGIHLQFGRIHHLLDDRAAAKVYLSEGAKICRENHLIWGISLMLTELGFIAEAEGRIAEALNYYANALEAATELEDIWNYHRTQACIGRTKMALGHMNEAIEILSLTLQELNSNPQIGFEIDCFVEIALILLHCGDVFLAIVLLEYCSTHPECFQPIRNRAAGYLATLKAESVSPDVSTARNLFPVSKRDVAVMLLKRLAAIKDA